ncbi:nuclear transport factor 2 family protein [Streptomyces sp. NPDC002952]|uniref:nuclear transport factor 2 family protein n=1 Tax=Streptomyces sp. NPDC002952 TaxID=3364673 RepID=UPI0036929B47
MTVELVATGEHPTPSQEFAALYAQVQQFYTHQLQLLDTHDTPSLAATFTKDAVLELPAPATPLPAREALARYPRAGAARLRGSGARLTHWLGMLDVQPRTENLHTRCSALVHQTPVTGGSKILYVCVMHDVLVHTAGTWRIAHRRITRDDLT